MGATITEKILAMHGGASISSIAGVVDAKKGY